MHCGIVRRRLEKAARSKPVAREVQEEDAAAVVAAGAEERVLVADVVALQPMIRSDREV